MHELAVIHEHPLWQEPLFSALKARGVDFVAIDLKAMAYESDAPPPARLVFNQATPSAYIRGNYRAIPQGLAYLRHLEHLGCQVINGSAAFALELSKAAQVGLSKSLGVDHPKSIVFNDVEAALAVNDTWPRLLKPDMGGSGARIQVVENETELRAVFEDANIWAPEHLFLLQEYLPHDKERGIIRLEYLEGELLYAMRVVTHGRFNLCPSVVCNPVQGTGICAVPEPDADARPVEFFPFEDVPREVIETGRKLLRGASIDVGAVEYLETPDGRRVFYDINANSNLRPSVAAHFGFDPFERVVDFLAERLS